CVDRRDRLGAGRIDAWQSKLADQFVENIVVKREAFPGARAFHILDKIARRIVCAADHAIPDSPNDLLELLLLPGAVPGIREMYDFPDEVVEATNLGGSSPCDRFHGRDDFGCR